MSRNNSSIELKCIMESINNNVKKLGKLANNVLNELKHQNMPKKTYVISDRMLTFLTLIVALLSLIVATYATYSSNKLAINNSALNFTYENINVEPIREVGEEFLINVGKDIGTQSVMKIHIDTEVISGQIKSLYLIQKRNNEYYFNLLNNDKVQDKFSGVKRYDANLLIDMEQKTDYESNNIGIGQLYILTEDINGKIDIDVIQIIGLINWIRNDDSSYIMDFGFFEYSYTFRYLKNNYLVTLYNENNDDEGWINLSDKYLDIVGETDVKRIEEDISIIKERYSKF